MRQGQAGTLESNDAVITVAEVDVRDKGALDCTIRARTLTAITRAGL